MIIQFFVYNIKKEGEVSPYVRTSLRPIPTAGSNAARNARLEKQIMARKQKKNRSAWLTVLIVLLAAGIWFYRNNPQFHAKVDDAVAAATEKIYSVLGIEPAPQTPAQEKQNSTAQNTPESQQTSPAPVQSPVTSDGVILLPDLLAYPVCAGTNHGKDHEIRNYRHYSICYRETYEQAEWSAYCLEEKELEKNAKRSDDFRPDPQITTGSAVLADYKGAGYDRGHLSPAADFAFSQEAMSETFYMSNMSPQAGSFNRGIWKDLESNVRDWAKKFGKVYVISGPVLDEDASAYAAIGTNRVSVPKYYYKVIMAPLYEDEADKATPDDAKKITAIAFILPNKKCDDSYFNYAVTIDEVEKRTGINFFESLEDSLEDALESGFDLELWK